jgi:hypothetical protein
LEPFFSSLQAAAPHLHLTLRHTLPVTLYKKELARYLMLNLVVFEIKGDNMDFPLSSIERNRYRFEPPSKVVVLLLESFFSELYPDTPAKASSIQASSS